MGTDKATIEFGGSSLASRVARALRAVAYPVFTVGHPADTGLPSVSDRGEGPLAALVDAVEQASIDGPVLVVACDLPFVDEHSLRALVDSLGQHDAAVPVFEGHAHPLCACYTPRALQVARTLVARGDRAMRDLLSSIDVGWIPAGRWASDVDTPEELASAKRMIEGSP